MTARREPPLRLRAILAFGQPIRDGVELIREQGMGTIVVLGSNPAGKRLCTGGTLADQAVTDEAILRSASDDSATIVGDGLDRIIRKGAILQSSRMTSATSPGTRHFSARRYARQTGLPVIAVSEERQTVTLYFGTDQYLLRRRSDLRDEIYHLMGALRTLRAQQEQQFSPDAVDRARTKLALLDGHLVELGEFGAEIMDECATIAEMIGLEWSPSVVTAPTAPQTEPVPDPFSGTAEYLPDEIELSSEVVETSRPDFESAGVPLPARFTFEELSQLVPPRPSRLADRLKALLAAVTVKPVLLEIGAAGLEMGRLQVIYRREIGNWPKDGPLDTLLVDAADVVTASRQDQPARLSPLARFVVGIAAALSVPPQHHPTLANWITAAGHQLGDAQAHYRERQSAPAWLLIDLGDEPQRGSEPWPTRIVWTHFDHTEQMTREVAVEPTETGLLAALRNILRDVPTVLAIPGGPRHAPRAARQGHRALARPRHGRRVGVVQRALSPPAAVVAPTPEPPAARTVPRADPAVELGDRARVDPRRDPARRRPAKEVGPRHRPGMARRWAHGATGIDPLRMLLREGCGFLDLVPGRPDEAPAARITEAVIGDSRPRSPYRDPERATRRPRPSPGDHLG